LPPGYLSSELAEGSPAQVLIDQSAGAELLVLGTAERASQSAGEGPPDVGPVARACLHAAACPVVIVTHAIHPARRPVQETVPAAGQAGRSLTS
jgi:hypothetical protein